MRSQENKPNPSSSSEGKSAATRFSLSTLFLWLTLAAAIAGLFAMRRQVVNAERTRDRALAEVHDLRSKFGYIEIDDDSKTYFAEIKSYEGENTYRLIVPAGSRYLLHISDTPMQNSKIPDALPRTKTYSMNGWRDGADVILNWGVWGGNQKRFVLSTQTQQLFNYEITNWNDSQFPNEGFDLAASPQKSFNTDEKIILSYFGNEKLGRGIILWMEPHSLWQQWHDRKSGK